jgi:hypothetical protein
MRTRSPIVQPAAMIVLFPIRQSLPICVFSPIVTL